jgi:undecaprenyl-diphosphatase
LEQVETAGPLTRLDTSAANDLHNQVRNSHLVVEVLKGISFFGSAIWIALIIIAAMTFFNRRGSVRAAVYLAVTAVLASGIDTLVKDLVDRPRPSLVDPVATASGQSFPSGHSMESLAVYGALLFVCLPLLPRNRRALAVSAAGVLVLLIGFSRLALGVHYITDVLGGYALGAAWLLLSSAVFDIRRAGPRGLGAAPGPDQTISPR